MSYDFDKWETRGLLLYKGVLTNCLRLMPDEFLVSNWKAKIRAINAELSRRNRTPATGLSKSQQGSQQHPRAESQSTPREPRSR